MTSSASDQAGAPVIIGLDNTGSNGTAVTAHPTDGWATLALKNSTGATLHLQRTTVSSAPAGAVYATTAGLGVAGSGQRHEVLTTANATMLVPIPPTRVLDTRSSAGRARLLEGRIDSQGRAVAGTFLLVHLEGIVEYGDGMVGNITVAKTEKGGFATVYGRGSRPTASTINWWAANQLLSNGFITQIDEGWGNGRSYTDTVGIYVQATTAIILDVTGVLVWHPDSAVINTTRTNARTLAAGTGTSEVRAREIKATAERGRKERTGA